MNTVEKTVRWGESLQWSFNVSLHFWLLKVMVGMGPACNIASYSARCTVRISNDVRPGCQRWLDTSPRALEDGATVGDITKNSLFGVWRRYLQAAMKWGIWKAWNSSSWSWAEVRVSDKGLFQGKDIAGQWIWYTIGLPFLMADVCHEIKARCWACCGECCSALE